MTDLRHAFRALLKSPVFTVVAILSLALAIGVNCGVFTIVNGMFLRPLFPLRPAEIVNVYTARADTKSDYRLFAFREIELLREAREIFVDVAAFRTAAVGIAPETGAEMQRRVAFVVSENYFAMLGVKPAAGRFFLPEEGRPNADIPAAVVSSDLWNRLSGGSEFRARTAAINGEVWNIVGVVPAGFSGGNALLTPDVWLPLGMASHVDRAAAATRTRRDLADPADFALFAIARLQPGLSLEGARVRLPAIAAQLTTTAADAAQGARTVEIGPPSRFSYSTAPSSDGPLGLFGMLLLGMAGVVLLVACLNLANMFLARNVARAPELAVRLALGASRGRVIRSLAVEGLLIALLGSGGGLLLSGWGNAFLVQSLASSSSVSSFGLSVSLDAAPDLRVLFATLISCTIATVLFALAPAWQATRETARNGLALHPATRTTTDRWGRWYSGRHCVLMAQLAFSLALLFGAGLFLRAAYAAARLDPGFQPDGVLVAELDYNLVSRADTDVLTTAEAIIDSLHADPSVRQVALATHLPFGNVTDGFDFSAAGASEENPRRVRGTMSAVSAGYFDTMGVRLLHGRDFSASEWRDPQGPRVVIIDERTAAALFPDENPVGQYVEHTRRPERSAAEPLQVIGVVSAHWHNVLADGPPPRAFFPLAARHPRHIFVHLRGATPAAAASGDLGRHVHDVLTALDPAIPLLRLAPYPAIIDRNIELWIVRFAAVLFGVFGAIALLLAIVGVYGVKAFFVARRAREFGIRVALGARPQQVLALVLKQGAIQIIVALLVGLLLALGTGQLLASMLLRVSPYDPLVLLLTAIPLAAAALLACWLPARRATRVNPVAALRAE